MKSSTLFRMVLIGMFFYLGAAALIAQNMPEMVSLREVTLKDGVDPINFHNLADIATEQIEDLSRGIHTWFWKGNRGKRSGKYLHTWGFDLKASRDYYFPSEGGGAPQMEALMAKVQMPGNVNLGDFVEGLDTYTDYAVLGFNSLVDPKGGAVVSLHEVEVPSGKEEAFEELIITQMQPPGKSEFPGCISTS